MGSRILEEEVEIVEIPGPPVGYTDLIDQALNNEEPREPYFPLRPSSAGYCGRRLAYDLMQYRGYASYPGEIQTPSVKRLLALGSVVETHSIRNFDLLKKASDELKVKYKQQVLPLFRLDPLPGEVVGQLIEGSMDLAVMMTNTGGIGDVKSTKDKFSTTHKTYWDENLEKFTNMSSLLVLSETAFYAPDLEMFLKELNDPFFEDNFRQVNLYACSDFAVQHGIDHAFIYRYCKNDSRHLEIRFKPSQKLYKEFQAKCNVINKSVAKKQPELVPKDYNLGSIKCAFCPYKDQCWDQNALKEYFNTQPKKNWPTDIGKINDTALTEDLSELFAEYELASQNAEKQQQIELELTGLLEKLKIKKIRLDNGNVYEVKWLKTPKPHMELRRSKV